MKNVNEALDLGTKKLKVERVIELLESGKASREMEALALALGITSADVFQIVASYLNYNMAEINTSIMMNDRD